MSTLAQQTILALDIGEKRVGVARANMIALLAEPLTTLTNDSAIFDRLRDILDREHVDRVIVGLPRGLGGQATTQTAYTEAFINKLKAEFTVPFFVQDEALSSLRAEELLKESKKEYQKGDIDSHAASLILQDFIDANLHKLQKGLSR